MHALFLAFLIAIFGATACKSAPKTQPDPEAQRTKNLEDACELNANSCDRLAFRCLEGLGTEVDPARAAVLFQRACEANNPRSCYHLAHLYEQGVGVEQNIERAKTLYRHACDAEVTEACNNLAVMLKRFGEDISEAKQLQIKGCNQGDGVACFNLGFQAEKSRPANWADAEKYYGFGCALKHGESCNYLGVMNRYGFGIEKNDEAASQLYVQACKFGSLLGCNSAAFAFQNGRGVEKDIDEAGRLFELACQAGLSRACTNLASLTEQGFKSNVNAFTRYQDACKAGDGKGCSRMGVLFLGGKHGAKKDLSKARDAFRKACDLEYAAGCSNLGVVYEEGYGLKKPNYEKAKEQYDIACRLKENQGCHNLGVMIANGVGGEPDLAAATDHFMQACEDGYLESCTFLGEKWKAVEGKEELGKNLLKRACQKGHQPACETPNPTPRKPDN